MGPQIAVLCLCLGVYFAAGTGSALVRSAGHTSLFKALEAVTGYLPYLSIAVLLLVGIAAVIMNSTGQPRSLAIKLLLVPIIAVIPFAIHVAMHSLTYSANPPTQRVLWGALSALEWVLLLFGGLLIGVGIFVLFRSRNTGVATPQE